MFAFNVMKSTGISMDIAILRMVSLLMGGISLWISREKVTDVVIVV
jgi:hypothetical protein